MTARELVVPKELVEKSARLLEDLCAISSPSGDRDGLYRVAARLAKELTARGLVPEIHAEPGMNGNAQPVLVARGPGNAGETTLLLGHLDTVLPAVRPSIEGTRLHGTGALDMKGGFAALAGALSFLEQSGEAMPPELVVVAVPDEEIGGPISARSVCHWGKAARVVLVLEPGASTEDGETLVVGRRGLTIWRLDARGKAAHSGVAYWEGRSALAAAAAWASTVQKLSEPGDGPVVNVGRIVGGDSEFVSDMGEEHRFIGTSERLNIVADRCLVEGEVRFLDLSDRDRVVSEMRRLADDLAETWEVEMTFDEVERIHTMAESTESRKLTRHLVGVAERAGWRLDLESNRGGVSFPNFLPEGSTACVVDGLGPVGGGMHTRAEFVDLESLERRIVLLAEALLFIRDSL